MKNINEMKFANKHGYSDVEPYEVVRVVSEKTIEIRRMSAEIDQIFKPEFIVGGFAAHCTNQHSQRWFYSSDETSPVIRARLRKDGYFYSPYGRHVICDTPRKFYDYNF